MDGQRGIILYDKLERVVGFVEVRNIDEITRVRVIHNFPIENLWTSIHEGGNFHLLELNEVNEVFEFDNEVNLEKEIFASIIEKNGDDIVPLASGIINADKPFEVPLSEPVVEVDRLLREMWIMDDVQAEKFMGCLYNFA